MSFVSPQSTADSPFHCRPVAPKLGGDDVSFQFRSWGLDSLFTLLSTQSPFFFKKKKYIFCDAPFNQEVKKQKTNPLPPTPKLIPPFFFHTVLIIIVPHHHHHYQKEKGEKRKTMRLPYVPDPPLTTSEQDAAIVGRIQARRHPRPLQPLDLTLLHSPPVADGWNSFLGAVRTQTVIPADLRELAISRVAVVNRAWYEWAHHAPLAVQGGVSERGMEAIKTEEELVLGEGAKEGLTEEQWTVACLADEMTRRVQVRDETFRRLRDKFSEREVVEIVATVS